MRTAWDMVPPGQVGTLQVDRVEAWKKLSAQNESEGVIHDDVDVGRFCRTLAHVL